MPAPETDYRFQCAQLWQRVGDDRYANPKVSARQSIMVRWENKKAEMLNPNGQSISVDAMVVVNCNIEIGSIMWLGSTTTTPTTDLMQVVAFENTPDVKGRVRRLVAGLKRYNDTFPAIV